MPARYRTNWATAFLRRVDPASDRTAPDWRASNVDREELGYDDFAEDIHCRRCFCGGRHLCILASSLGIQSRHGLHVQRTGKDDGDEHGARREEPPGDDEACRQGTQQYRLLHGPRAAVLLVRNTRSYRQLLSPVIGTARDRAALAGGPDRKIGSVDFYHGATHDGAFASQCRPPRARLPALS